MELISEILIRIYLESGDEFKIFNFAFFFHQNLFKKTKR